MKLRWSRQEPGLLLSGAGHAALLVAALVGLASAPRFDDQEEAVPVEVITESQLRAITRGEKTSKEVSETQSLRAETQSDVRDVKPDTATDRLDAPAPPSRPRDLPQAQENAPPPAAAEKPAPKPEPRPEPKPEPAPKPDPAPVPPPRPEPAPEPKPEPKPEPEPTPEPKPKPEPKPRLEPKPRPEPKPEPPARRDLAKLIENSKPAPKPAEKPAAKPAPDGDSFNPTDIRKLLASRNSSQRTASSAPELNQRSTAGTQTGTGPKLSMSQRDALGAMIKEQLAKCWSPPLGANPDLKPEVRLVLGPDGALVGQPAVINSSSDPGFRAMADSAVRAVRMCAPFQVPQQFAPFYNDWRNFRITFDARDFLG